MPLNRRDFFGQFWGADGKRAAERRTRCEALETYVWTNLLPYDFALNDAQNKDLDRELRAYLARVSDDALFSADITRRLEDFVGNMVVPWRQEYFSRNSE